MILISMDHNHVRFKESRIIVAQRLLPWLK
jgi:hypothetical protein